jgi:hypothetical protein
VVERDLTTLVGRVQPPQEIDRGRLGDVAGPADRRRGRRREGRDVEIAEHRQIVVPDQAQRAAFLHDRCALVGVGPVADDVAEAPELVDAGALHVGENRLEGGQVGVDVADDGEAHRGERGGLS